MTAKTKTNRVSLKMITLIMPKGRASSLVEYLYEQGHTRTNLHNARGFLIGGAKDRSGQPHESEQEMLTVLVGEKEADEVFADIYHRADFHNPNSGFMFMESIEHATDYSLPQALETN